MSWNKEQFALFDAVMNGTSAILLVLAYIAIKRQMYRTHGWLVCTAIVTSAIFLTSYLTSKFLFGEQSTKQWGLNPVRILYLVILFPHVLAAVGMLPFIAFAVWRAYKRQWAWHRRVATPTFWVWLYVSVSGVVIYLMLYHILPGMKTA